MGRSRSRALVGATLLLGLFAGASAPRAGAQAPAEPPRPHKSVYGKLASVDKSRSGIVMKSASGERLSWQFDAAVIAEASRFKPGDPMIVIYRQVAPNEKRVTALAFRRPQRSGRGWDLRRTEHRHRHRVHDPQRRCRRGAGGVLVLRGAGRKLQSGKQVGAGPRPPRAMLPVERPRRRAPWF